MNSSPKSDLELFDWARGIEALFDSLSDVYFFAKDRNSRFIAVNRGFAEHQVGKSDKTVMLGRTDFDFWPRQLAEKYVKDDQYVMSTGKSLVNVVELAFYPNHSTDWISTTKVPLYDRAGDIIGLAGYCRDLKKQHQGPQMWMGEVFDYVMRNYASSIDIAELAALTYLSVSQFERRFKSMFHLTPMKYVSLVRINAACQALAEGKERISDIALHSGFYDLSHFNRQFRKTMGMPPGAFRKRYFQSKDYPRIPGLQIYPPLPPKS